MTTYKLRAECDHDVFELLKSRVIGAYTLERDYLGPDVEFTFKSALDLPALKAAIAKIPDGHVMLETVALAADYTGERRDA